MNEGLLEREPIPRKFKVISVVCVGIVVVLFIILLGVLGIPPAFLTLSPEVKFDSITIANFSSNDTNNGTSFSMDLIALVSIKNPNVGFFDYDKSKVSILYRGMTVGEAVIRQGLIIRETELFNVTIPISSEGLNITPSLRNGTDMGVLAFESQGRLSGTVSTTKLNDWWMIRWSCTMSVELRTRVVQDLMCTEYSVKF